MVILVDSASATIASALSDERGAFFLRATKPGTFRLRTLRIGFRATISPAFALAAGQDVTRQLDVEEIKFLLDTVRVTGRNACRMATDSAVATFAVWEQVRTVLTAVQLTAQEFRILSYLMHHPERVVSRTELMEHVYDRHFDGDSNVLEVLLGRIRREIGAELIRTVRGQG